MEHVDYFSMERERDIERWVVSFMIQYTEPKKISGGLIVFSMK